MEVKKEKRSRKPTELQQEQFLKNQDDILKNIKVPSRPSEIRKKTHLSYATIRSHTKILLRNGQAKRHKGKLVSLYSYFELVGDTMKAYTQELQQTLASLSKPETIIRAKNEGTWQLPKRFPMNTDPKVPASISFMNKKEWNEFFTHKEKVFGGLRRCFLELAKVVMKVDVGLMDVEEDLSNVECYFQNGEPCWIVYPKELQWPRETVEEYKARMEERKKKLKEVS